MTPRGIAGRKDAKALTDSIHAITDTVKKIVQLEINSLEFTDDEARSDFDEDLVQITTEGEMDVTTATSTTLTPTTTTTSTTTTSTSTTSTTTSTTTSAKTTVSTTLRISVSESDLVDYEKFVSKSGGEFSLGQIIMIALTSAASVLLIIVGILITFVLK